MVEVVHEEVSQSMVTEAMTGQEATVEVEAAQEAEEDEEVVAEAEDRTTTITARLQSPTDKMQRQCRHHHSREEGASLVLA